MQHSLSQCLGKAVLRQRAGPGSLTYIHILHIIVPERTPSSLAASLLACHRCQVDESKKWHMVCGRCCLEVSGGKVDGAPSQPHYRYGGLWKNHHAGVTGKQRQACTSKPWLLLRMGNIEQNTDYYCGWATQRVAGHSKTISRVPASSWQ